MKSNRNTRAVTVGIFVVVGLIIFVAAILALGGQRKTFADTISISSIFDDVNGLQAGSNIWFAGVKIGTVKKIAFTAAGLVDVQMNIEEKSKKYIHKNAKSKIGTDGLIGNKIVVIYGGTADVPEIVEGDVLNVERAIGMDDMLNTFQSNNKNLLDITANFKAISKRLADGQGSIGKLLNDETLYNDVQSTLLTLRHASANAQQLTASIANYTSKLGTKGTLANDLVTDTVVFSRLKAASSRIDQLTRTANTMAENLSMATNELNNSLKDNNTPAGVLLHDQQTAANIKATVKNLQSGSEKLDQDLEAVQHNFLLRGFFKKKAKAIKDSTANK